jgi:Tol biopolymer transport system component
MRPGGRRVVWGLPVVACLAACAGFAVADGELPASPIAIHYRTPEESRRRADALMSGFTEQIRGQRNRRRSLSANAVVPHVEQLEGLLHRVLGREGERESHAGRLALLDPRTREVVIVAGALRGAIPVDWSTDRRRLLFAQPEGAHFQLFELRVEDGRIHRLTGGPGSHLQGCYGPEGRLVATAARREGETVRSLIAVSAPGGRGPFVSISQGPVDHSPACAPDGGSVAWVAEARRGHPRILVSDLASGFPPRMASPGRDPTWAPDSAWLLFSGPRGRSWKLWRARADAGGRVPLGRGALDEFRPAVSPDGRFVAYVASEDVPKRHLYLRRFDGSGDRILFADGDAEHPVW